MWYIKTKLSKIEYQQYLFKNLHDPTLRGFSSADSQKGTAQK